MSIPFDGTYTVPVSGPSVRLAMLRAVLLKATGVARHGWAHIRATLSIVGRMPRTAAAAVSSVLATRTGYGALTGSIRTVVSTAWRLVTGAARLFGRACRFTAGLGTLAVGYLSPGGADLTLRLADTVADRVSAAARHVDAAVRRAGDLMWLLAHTCLVRTTVTTAASTASALFVVHTLSQGLIAVKIVKAMPWLMTAVVWATDPRRTLLLVLGAAAAAMLLALARLLHTRAPGVDDGPQYDPEPPAAASTPLAVVTDEKEEPTPTVPVIDWDAVAASVRIEITNDGSVLVVGIPNSVPKEYGELIARIATDAALTHWRRTRTSRPTPSRDDRRLFTKAAKEAVRKHAHSQAA